MSVIFSYVRLRRIYRHRTIHTVVNIDNIIFSCRPNWQAVDTGFVQLGNLRRCDCEGYMALASIQYRWFYSDIQDTSIPNAKRRSLSGNVYVNLKTVQFAFVSESR